MRNFKTVLFAFLFLALPSFADAISTSAILELVNAERKNAGLSPVQMNAKLSQAGQIKASDMASRGYFDHISPDGVDPWDLLDRVGYGWEWAGENLGLSSDMQNEALIVKSWMESPGHRAIIMDARYTETGIGIAEGTYQGRRVVFVSQFFGLPKSAPAPIQSAPTQTAPAQIAPAPSVIPVSAAPAPTPVMTVQPQIQSQAQAVAQTVAVQTKQTVQAEKPVSKATSVVNAVVKKAEAEEVMQATTTATVETASSTSLRTVEHPVVIKASLFTRIKLFFARIFTFSA